MRHISVGLLAGLLFALCIVGIFLTLMLWQQNSIFLLLIDVAEANLKGYDKLPERLSAITDSTRFKESATQLMLGQAEIYRASSDLVAETYTRIQQILLWLSGVFVCMALAMLALFTKLSANNAGSNRHVI